MKQLYLVLVGMCGGVLAGMGMGGGTLTIPMLVLLLGIEQSAAQFINVLAFLPTGIIAVVLHVKNKLISTRNVLFLLVPAVLATAVSATFAFDTSESVLRYVFGGFLILVAIFSFVGFSFAKK